MHSCMSDKLIQLGCSYQELLFRGLLSYILFEMLIPLNIDYLDMANKLFLLLFVKE